MGPDSQGPVLAQREVVFAAATFIAVAVDHQTTYMEIILGFMGFTDVRSIVVEPTLMGGPETAASRRGAAVRKATEMAKDF